MLENDLLLSTFAAKYLNGMDENNLKYDQLINGLTNNWDIYYWATGNKPTPEEYNSSVMNMLKKNAKNNLKEQRIRKSKEHAINNLIYIKSNLFSKSKKKRKKIISTSFEYYK